MGSEPGRGQGSGFSSDHFYILGLVLCWGCV